MKVDDEAARHGVHYTSIEAQQVKVDRTLAKTILGVATVGAVCFILAYAITERSDHRVIDARLATLAQDVAAQVKERITTYQYGLRGARGFIIGATIQGLSYEGFRDYAASRDLETEFPGSHGFGYIARVPEGETDAFVLKARSDGRPYYSVSQLSPHDGERYLILYIEPEGPNKEAVGLDIASEATRREAARDALRTGEVALTRPITLVQASGKRFGGFLLMMPVYRNGKMPQAEADREAATVGWTYTPIVIDEVLRSLRYQSEDYYLRLYDVPVATGESRTAGAGVEREDRDEIGWIEFFSSMVDDEAERSWAKGEAAETEATIIHMDLFSRRWAIEVAPTADFVKRLNLPSPPVAGGITAAFSLLLSGVALLLLQNRARTRQGRLENERLAMVVENSSDAIVGTTPQGAISSWNRSAEKLFGYSTQEATGKVFSSLVAPKEEEEREQARAAALLAGVSQGSYQARYISKNGAALDVSIAMSPIIEAVNRVVGITRVIRDIGETKRFEARLIALNNSLENQVAERTAALDEQNKRLAMTSDNLRMIIEAAPYALIMVDRGGLVEDANALAERIFGYRRKELIGKPIEFLLPPQYRSTHVDYRENIFLIDASRPIGRGREVSALRKNGKEFPAEIGFSNIQTPQGIKVIVAVVDITLRKEHEKLIQEFAAFQEAILSYAGFAIIATAPDRIITLFNHEAERMLGYKAEEVVGKRNPELFHQADELERRSIDLSEQMDRKIPPDFSAVLGRAQEGLTDEYEWTFVRKDQSVLPVLLRESALFDAAGKVLGYLGIAVDLTERNENARKLKSYSEHLSDMVRERTIALEAAQQKLLSQERLQRELRLAAEIQEALGTKTPPPSEYYDIAIFARPARFVSGDIYDAITGEDARLFLFLADISGKGVPAALMTTAARALFRQGVRNALPPSEIYGEIEALLSKDLAHSELFMTCQISELDYGAGTLVYRNAGHTETIIRRSSDASVEFFRPTDLPVGVEAPPGLESTGELSSFLCPGDIVVYYSDGLTELTDPGGVQFGVSRLKDVVAAAADSGAQAILGNILGSIKAYGGDKEAEDDTSVIVVKVRPGTIRRRWAEAPREMDRLVAAISAPCRGYGPTFAYELELATTELISNIYRHAYGLRFDEDAEAGKTEGALIEMELRLEEGGIVLDLFDHGAPFPEAERERARPLGNPSEDGGYGLSIIAELSREFTYDDSVPGTNHWKIVKNMERPV